MTPSSDERWQQGMNGWRVRIYDWPGPVRMYNWPGPVPPASEYGEITGYEHSGCFVWVVLDGESEPRQFRWDEVRPA